jgi:DNA polymerase-1
LEHRVVNPNAKLLAIDIETESLKNPQKIHVICTEDQDGLKSEFIDPLNDLKVRSNFLRHVSRYDVYILHYGISFDLPVLKRLLGWNPPIDQIIDTLVVSRLMRFGMQGGHSLEVWGERLGIAKMHAGMQDFSVLTPELLERCHSDTKVTMAVFRRWEKYLRQKEWQRPLYTEQRTQQICQMMSENGFGFNLPEAKKMRAELQAKIDPIDKMISELPPKVVPVREVQPRLTKHGGLNLNDFRWLTNNDPAPDLRPYSDAPFTVIEFQQFNPGSTRQMVERLNEAGWKPTEKTDGHIKALKDKNIEETKLEHFKQYGWKVSEENLKTLPADAPEPMKKLAERIMLASRLSDLDEWLALVETDATGVTSVHGHFNGIGASTHRLSHAKPNLANVPTARRTPNDTPFETYIQDISEGMRSLWQAREGTVLVGTDASGIHMRIFAHLIEDPRLVEAILGGDIHELHRGALGEACPTRHNAKTFIYSFLNGGSIPAVIRSLGCSPRQAKVALENFTEFYPGLAKLKRELIPLYADQGYFKGLDGRLVACASQHLMMSNILQNAEVIIMKQAAIQWHYQLKKDGIPFKLVTWPHDEWQTEVPEDPEIIARVQSVQIQSIRDQTEILGMKCPLDAESRFGKTWKETH